MNIVFFLVETLLGLGYCGVTKHDQEQKQRGDILFSFQSPSLSLSRLDSLENGNKNCPLYLLLSLRASTSRRQPLPHRSWQLRRPNPSPRSSPKIRAPPLTSCWSPPSWIPYLPPPPFFSSSTAPFDQVLQTTPSTNIMIFHCFRLLCSIGFHRVNWVLFLFLF